MPDSVSRSGLQRFLTALHDALVASAAADPATSSALHAFADLTASIALPERALTLSEDLAGELLPVCRFWNAALASAGAGPLTEMLEALGPTLSWTQNPNYRRRPPGPSFLDNYGYAVIVGPADGPRALLADPRLAVGVLLLGPDTHYPLHSHPAAEVYYTLTPDGEWWRGDGPWQRERPGTAIYHAPKVRHATRAGADPLLAIYLWSGELATHAQLDSTG